MPRMCLARRGLLLAAAGLALAACGGTPQGGGLNLKVNVWQTGSVAVGVFVSDASGALLAERTVPAGAGFTALSFANVPADALVTAAYRTRAPHWIGGQYQDAEIVRLVSYPAAYIDGQGYEVLYGDPTLANVKATLFKPSLPDAISGVWSWYGSNFGANPSVTLSGYVYASDVGLDGLYLPVFYVLGAHNALLAYKALPPQPLTMTGPAPDFPQASFTVNAADWNTSLNTVNLQVSNVPLSKSPSGATHLHSYCGNLEGARQGVDHYVPGACQVTADTAARSVTYSFKYPGGVFEGLNYQAGFAQDDATRSDGYYACSYVYARSTGALPTGLQLNALSDLLAPPADLAVTEATSARPAFDWTNPSFDPSHQAYVNLDVYGSASGYDFDWWLAKLPGSTDHLRLPQLPDSLAALAPTEGASGRAYMVEADAYELTAAGESHRWAYTVHALTATGATSLQPAGVEPAAGRAPRAERGDPFAIRLR